MAVNATHPDYDATLPAWLRARDVLAGEDAVKAGGEKYLPRLDSQSEVEFANYVKRASFFNATARTAEAYLGLIFRRPPFVRLPESSSGVRSGLGRALADFANDADMLGSDLAGYAKVVVSEVVGLGRGGTLVDWEGGGATSHLAENRAYATYYRAEQIINWRVERVRGRNVPTLVVLRETAELPGEDEFEPERVEQIRTLRLVVDADNNHFCRVDVWQLRRETQQRKAEWVVIESRVPRRLGRALPLIPFVFHGPQHSRPSVGKGPLEDIIAVNLDHYRLDADFKHGLHFTALPTAWVSGFDKAAALRIGSSTAWVSETPGATAGFLEFTGQGLTTFERAMDRDERLMAVLGSRMLEDMKKVGETATAIELRQSGEYSILGTVALSVSESLTQVLRWVYWWNSTEEFPDDVAGGQVLMQLNTDFSSKGLSSQDLQAVVAAWLAGAMSQDTMLELFRRGEILPEGRTNEEEAELIKNQRPESFGQKEGRNNGGLGGTALPG